MPIRLHELWVESDGGQTFCLAGSKGDGVRAMLLPGSRLIWTVEAGSHFEAMTKYYERMGWGVYKIDHESDYEPYDD